MKKILLLVFITSLCTINCLAQQGTVASSANGSSSTGNISFSLGQVAYISIDNLSGKVNQGLQQPFEITDINLFVENQANNIKSAIIYPNPSAKSITLSLYFNAIETSLNYVFTDLNGKILRQEKIISSETIINIENLTETLYLVNILEERGKVLKSFKLVKKN